MKAKSIKGNSTEEIKAALTETMEGKFKPTLAIVFISVKQDREAISRLLDEKGIQIFGATTAGFFSYGEYGKSKTGKHEFHNNACCVVVLKEK